MSLTAPVRTTCPYCGVGCGVLAKLQPDGAVKIEGDPEHPANFGKLCSKGLALGETLSLAKRQLHPLVDGLETDWDNAIATVAERFKQTIAEHGPESVAFYVSGQLLTEDYYVANKLMKGFIGTANIDTNSRLCMASAVAGHKRAFGADIVPCSYSDLEAADLIVLVGSNLAWCHPVLFQRIQAEREKRGLKLVVIDPRRTATAEAADLHLQIAGESDVALFNGLLSNLYSRGEIDSRFVFARTTGLAETLVVANEWTLDKTAAATDVPAERLQEFFDLFAATSKTVTMFSMGVNQSASGTDKVNAIINCHLLTGRIGKTGSGPFSVTGQPNAMGGREVGGLANMLAAHMDFQNADHREAIQQHWQSPTLATKPGLKAVDMFEAVADGRIKAIWIISTNPVVSMPNAGGVAQALEGCPFVVVSDITAQTDTAKFADVFLPATAWGEKDGTVTNSERCISRQRAFLAKPGATLPDWKIISDVATAMGFAGFDYPSPAEIFAEHVALTQKCNAGTRKFDLTAWRGQDYAHLQPQQWGGANPFEDLSFETADGKARFVATTFHRPNHQAYRLNTGRIRDQWHTMTRTGLSPRLFSHRAEPYVEIHPSDATSLGIAPATLVDISGMENHSLARALVTDTVKPGTIFQPMHWSSHFAKHALVNRCVEASVDPTSGQPAMKSSQVFVNRFEVAWYGFGIAQGPVTGDFDYFAQHPLERGQAFECAGKTLPGNWAAFTTAAFPNIQISSSVSGGNPASYRCAAILNDRLIFAFFVSDQPVSASRNWMQQQLGNTVNPLEILAGRPLQVGSDKGPILCACMNIGRYQIADFISKNHGASLQTLCDATTAGTGCGSCRIEVQRMLKDAHFTHAAE